MLRRARIAVTFALLRLAAVSALVVGWGSAALTADERGQAGASSGEKAGPARRAGGGFEFRRKLSSIDNPYCDVTTYVLPALSKLAASTVDARDRSIIMMDASTLRSDSAYAHFLMAHECCHHTLGHTRLTLNRLGQLGPQPFYYLRPLLKNMELDADRCAVKMLKLTKEPDAIEAGRLRMLSYGNAQTGAYYPTGVERSDNIARAAAEE